MKKALIVAIAVLGFAMPASALDIEAVTAQPTADNPQFDNKEVWPDLVGDEYFLKEKWPKTRLLIWAHAPSTEVATAPVRGAPRPDIADPASWIDAATGRPADAVPDMDTDVILPDAERPYSVTGNGFTCRHLTVGRNADFQPGGGSNADIFGNVWIRPGGIFYVYRRLVLVGGCNAFFRHDWPEDGKLKKLHDTGAIITFDPANKQPSPWGWRADRRPCVSHFFEHDRPDGSTEMIGYNCSRDEVRIKAGRFIVGRDSRFLCGGAAMLDIHQDAAIVLMDGAVTGKTVNQFGGCLRMQGGQLTGGTPDRPIKRDARIGVGYCNWMNLSFPDQRVSSRRGNAYDYGRFSASVSGKLIGYPAEGSDARLVFGWQRVSIGGGGRGVNATDGFNHAFAKLPPKITVWMDSETRVENVRFEDLHRGGIVTPSLTAAKNWKNVTYGEGCLSTTPEELIREYTGKIDRGRPMEPLTPEKKYTSM